MLSLKSRKSKQNKALMTIMMTIMMVLIISKYFNQIETALHKAFLPSVVAGMVSFFLALSVMGPFGCK